MRELPPTGAPSGWVGTREGRSKGEKGEVAFELHGMSEMGEKESARQENGQLRGESEHKSEREDDRKGEGHKKGEREGNIG